MASTCPSPSPASALNHKVSGPARVKRGHRGTPQSITTEYQVQRVSTRTPWGSGSSSQSIRSSACQTWTPWDTTEYHHRVSGPARVNEDTVGLWELFTKYQVQRVSIRTPWDTTEYQVQRVSIRTPWDTTATSPASTTEGLARRRPQPNVCANPHPRQVDPTDFA